MIILKKQSIFWVLLVEKSEAKIFFIELMIY